MQRTIQVPNWGLADQLAMEDVGMCRIRLESSRYMGGCVCAQSSSAKWYLPNWLFSPLEKQGKLSRLLALQCFWDLSLAGCVWYHLLGHRVSLTSPGCFAPWAVGITTGLWEALTVLEKHRDVGKSLSLAIAFLMWTGRICKFQAWNWALVG